METILPTPICQGNKPTGLFSPVCFTAGWSWDPTHPTLSDRTAEHSFTKTVSIETDGPIEVHFGKARQLTMGKRWTNAGTPG